MTLSRAINRQLKQLVEREGVLEEGSKDQTLEQLSEKRPERLPEKLVEQPQRTKVATKTAARNFPKNRPLPVRHRPVTRGWIEVVLSSPKICSHPTHFDRSSDAPPSNSTTTSSNWRRPTIQLVHFSPPLFLFGIWFLEVETNNKLSRKKHRVTKVIKHEDDEEHVFDKETDFDSALEIVYYKKGLTQPVTAVIKEDTTEVVVTRSHSYFVLTLDVSPLMFHLIH